MTQTPLQDFTQLIPGFKMAKARKAVNVRRLKLWIDNLLEWSMDVIEEEPEQPENEDDETPDVEFKSADLTFNRVLEDLKSSG